ncbi:MAG: hypothetical protein PHP95_09470 [Desulfuromonadaceae bacterium]|nr:hypothetical protein [Desulfuromonadaceae bacterium]MDD2848673.1 hypothetical protein [Desulfuromonadaceae bacterium]MDD4130824.1 hypothetical protein [Desulfuromonadaceae bacterium]
MMKKAAIIYSLIFILVLSGCATTGSGNSEKPTEWTLEEVGKGMTVGSAASSAGVFAPIIFVVGFVMEKVGRAIKTDPEVNNNYVYHRTQETEEPSGLLDRE